MYTHTGFGKIGFLGAPDFGVTPKLQFEMARMLWNCGNQIWYAYKIDMFLSARGCGRKFWDSNGWVAYELLLTRPVERPELFLKAEIQRLYKAVYKNEPSDETSSVNANEWLERCVGDRLLKPLWQCGTYLTFDHGLYAYKEVPRPLPIIHSGEPKNTMCACGCGNWANSFSPGGSYELYIRGHEPKPDYTHIWIRLGPNVYIKRGDRFLFFPDGAFVGRNSRWIGHKVREHPVGIIYRPMRTDR